MTSRSWLISYRRRSTISRMSCCPILWSRCTPSNTSRIGKKYFTKKWCWMVATKPAIWAPPKKWKSSSSNSRYSGRKRAWWEVSSPRAASRAWRILWNSTSKCNSASTPWKFRLKIASARRKFKKWTTKWKSTSRWCSFRPYWTTFKSTRESKSSDANWK